MVRDAAGHGQLGTHRINRGFISKCDPASSRFFRVRLVSSVNSFEGKRFNNSESHYPAAQDFYWAPTRNHSTGISLVIPGVMERDAKRSS